jgi:hypothetical protein
MKIIALLFVFVLSICFAFKATIDSAEKQSNRITIEHEAPKTDHTVQTQAIALL